MQTQKSVLMGKITGVFGVKGWLKLSSFADPPEKLGDYSPWRISDSSKSIIFDPLEFKPHGKAFIARLEGIKDRDQAKELTGMDIFLARNQLGELDAGQYYWSDLEGLIVKDINDQELGRVEQMIPAGASDVMVIEGDQRILIPFSLNETVVSVDIEKGFIRVDWEKDGCA
ncbi:MAG: ribosome maturation factor RimM [Pseudomonadota bacterium]|nr:ribosome maturation factor RimM [Pseudomonadota bacterium]